MGTEEQPHKADLGIAEMRPWWLLPLLVAVLAGYILWMGETLAWNHQRGHYWFFLAPWWTTTSLKFLAISGVLGTLFHLAGDRIRRWLPRGLAGLLLGGQCWLARAAWRTLGGNVPWGFDHPSFMFRLKEFGDLFPFALGGYNPWWNAGTEHFVGVTSGAHGFGILILPLLKIWEPHQFYGAALIFWFIFGFPWLGVAAVRAAGASRAGALCAGLLMCGAGREVFMWMWHFGTVGAMTSAMMALPVASLGYRLAVLGRGGWGTVLALGLSSWVMCLWTPGVFVGAGLALGWLWNVCRWTWRANLRLLAAGVLALVMLAPWFWTTLFPCRNVVAYVGNLSDRSPATEMAFQGASRLLTAIQEWHPALAIIGLLGALVVGPRELRRWMLPMFIVLGGLTGWGREFNPLSQMERMAIPMAAAAVLPAAILCGQLLDAGPSSATAVVRGSRGIIVALAQGIVLAVFLLGLGRVRMFYTNHDPTGIRIRTLPAEIQEFTDWIRAEVPAEGRLGFAGPAVHFYGGGNIAYLPVLAEREMMADDYYGFPRGTIEYNYPPRAYRKNADLHLFFAHAYGITHWVTVVPETQAYLRAHPGDYELAKTLDLGGRTAEIYRVKDIGPVTRFWEGAGTVSAHENHIDVIPADPSAERVVIRYNWRNGLVCRTPGATIEPFPVDENLRFIAVHPGGQPRVEIGYRPHWTPVQPNFDGQFHH